MANLQLKALLLEQKSPGYLGIYKTSLSKLLAGVSF